MKPEEKARKLINYSKNSFCKFNQTQSEIISLIVCEEILHQLDVLKSSVNSESIKERIVFFNKVKKEIERIGYEE